MAVYKPILYAMQSSTASNFAKLFLLGLDTVV